MAGKRLDKLRQWAGEVISSKDKTIVTDEFKALETDIELRRKGIFKLHQVTDNYHRFLSKKKDLEALPEEPDKLSARDALGIVMISHGQEFGDESAFGTCLVRLGQGMCKIATLQETHALTLQGNFLAGLQVYLDEIKEYQEQRKKLESRRLTYDAAMNKLERLKGSKKEKDKQEAEEEFETAKTRYEDTSEDVHTRMHGIQENEISQLRDLGGFLDMEIRFAENYLEVMKDVKADWVDQSNLERVSKRPTGPSHTFPSRSPGTESKFNSVRSHKSSKSNPVDSSSEEDVEVTRPSMRRKSTSSRRKSEVSEKPPSRPASRTSRKRSDSNTTVGEKDKDKGSRKISVTGWASSAVSSIRGKKDKENFVGLREGDADEDTDEEEKASSPRKTPPKPASRRSTPSGSPSIPVKILKATFHKSSASLEEKKVVRAIYDFTGSVDELSFRTGDEIVLLNEVLEGWWMGELEGKKGLFPTTYTEVVSTTPPSTRTAPPIPQRLVQSKRSYGANTSSEEDEQSKMTLVGADDDAISASITSDDDDHPFGDHNHLIANSRSPVYGTFNHDVTDITDDESSLRSQRSSVLEDEQSYIPAHLRRPASKKAPPPPPPRRIQTTNNPNPPPLPDRRPPHLRSQSAGALAKAMNGSIREPEFSPFDSPVRAEFAPETKKNPFRA